MVPVVTKVIASRYNCIIVVVIWMHSILVFFVGYKYHSHLHWILIFYLWMHEHMTQQCIRSTNKLSSFFVHAFIINNVVILHVRIRQHKSSSSWITIIINHQQQSTQESPKFQNHILHKRQTIIHIMTFIILHTQSSLIHSYSIISSWTQSYLLVIQP